VPRNAFLTAGEAWLRCRAGNDDPDNFGQGSVRGQWFISVNVVRDALAIGNLETSAWDRWREAGPQQRTVSSPELAALDELARDPEQAGDEWVPPWLGASRSSDGVDTRQIASPLRARQ
jgi:hypothetical protein